MSFLGKLHSLATLLGHLFNALLTELATQLIIWPQPQAFGHVVVVRKGKEEEFLIYWDCHKQPSVAFS